MRGVLNTFHADETESQLEERILESGSAPTETVVSFIYNDSCIMCMVPV